MIKFGNIMVSWVIFIYIVEVSQNHTKMFMGKCLWMGNSKFPLFVWNFNIFNNSIIPFNYSSRLWQGMEGGSTDNLLFILIFVSTKKDMFRTN